MIGFRHAIPKTNIKPLKQVLEDQNLFSYKIGLLAGVNSKSLSDS